MLQVRLALVKARHMSLAHTWAHGGGHSMKSITLSNLQFNCNFPTNLLAAEN